MGHLTSRKIGIAVLLLCVGSSGIDPAHRIAAETNVPVDTPLPLIHLPASFWDLPPKEAALRLVDTNRSEKHRLRYNLVTADPATLGSNLCIGFESQGPGCYSSNNEAYCLSNTSKPFFAYATIDTPHTTLVNAAITPSTQYTIGFNYLNPELANWVESTLLNLWSLSTELSPTRDSRSLPAVSSWSSADRHGRVRIWQKSAGQPIASCEGSIRHPYNSNNQAFVQTLGFSEEDRLNFIADLLTRKLMQTPAISARSEAEIHYSLIEILKRYSDDEAAIPTELVRIAAQAAGDHLVSNAKPRLQSILERCPVPSQETISTIQREAELVNQIQTINRELRRLGIRYGQQTSNDPTAQALIESEQRLQDARKAIDLNHAERSKHDFYQAIATALSQLEHADDPQALREMVETNSPAADWAIYRLGQHYPQDFITCLNVLLESKNEDTDAILALIRITEATLQK